MKKRVLALLLALTLCFALLPIAAFAAEEDAQESQTVEEDDVFAKIAGLVERISRVIKEGKMPPAQDINWNEDERVLRDYIAEALYKNDVTDEVFGDSVVAADKILQALEDSDYSLERVRAALGEAVILDPSEIAKDLEELSELPTSINDRLTKIMEALFPEGIGTSLANFFIRNIQPVENKVVKEFTKSDGLSALVGTLSGIFKTLLPDADEGAGNAEGTTTPGDVVTEGETAPRELSDFGKLVASVLGVVTMIREVAG